MLSSLSSVYVKVWDLSKVERGPEGQPSAAEHLDLIIIVVVRRDFVASVSPGC